MNDDDFLMSLNDTLACGLGASLLLFIVFVILINVEDQRSEPGQARRIVDDISSTATGDELAHARPSLFLRMRGPCKLIETVTINGTDVEKSLFVDTRDGDEGYKTKCVALLALRDPKPDSGIEVITEVAPEGEILLTATWGGQSLTGIEGAKADLESDRCSRENVCLLATVHLDGKGEPIRWAK